MMRNKLLLINDFELDIELPGYVTKLLKEVRRIGHQMESNTSNYDTIDEAKTNYYGYCQGDEESNAKHLQRFKNIQDLSNMRKRRALKKEFKV